MADETTTTTLTELVNTEFISSRILDYAHDFVVASPFLRLEDLRGKASGVVSVPQWVLDAVTDITNETTALANVALETTDTQVTTAEMGILREVTMNAREDNILGDGVLDFILQDAGRLLALGLEDDVCALFTSISTSVGTSGSNLTLAQMAGAISQIRKNKVRAPGGLVFILDDQQSEDYDAAILAATSTTVNSYVNRAGDGLDNGFLGTFSGHPVWQTGLCDTANTGANVVGACFVRGDVASNISNAWAVLALSRPPTADDDKNIALRTKKIAVSARWAPAEVNAAAATAITTDA